MQNKIADQIIANQLNLFRLTAGEQQKAISSLRQLRQELTGLLASSNFHDISKAKINSTLKKIDEVINEYYAKIEIPADGIAAHEVNATVYAMSPASPVQPSAAMVKAIGKDLLIMGSPVADWYKAQSKDLSFKVAAQIRQGAANGETTYQITNRVKLLFPPAERSISALVHTTIQTIANNARLETFKANSEVLNGIEQLSTLDSHTSDICIAYSGAKWDLNGDPIAGNNLPFNGGTPRHFNCRSVIVPIVKSLSELAGEPVQEPLTGTRASDQGQISASTTMNQFLKGKSDAYVDDLLGKGRAQLWRDGKITLKDLVDQRGRPLTLDQLAKKYG